jgi:hypothetical protein
VREGAAGRRCCRRARRCSRRSTSRPATSRRRRTSACATLAPRGSRERGGVEVRGGGLAAPERRLAATRGGWRPPCVDAGEPPALLHAPGILKNPVPIDALYDREAAHEQTLKNLLQRKGYESLDAVTAKGVDIGRLVEARSALRRVLARRKLALAAEDGARIDACTELATLERWHDQAIDAQSADDALR